MSKIKYSENFYTNDSSRVNGAKNSVALFNNNMHKKIKKNLDDYKEKNFPEPEWQAVIVGESKYKDSSISSIGLFFINSQFLAYAVNKDAVNNKSLLNQFGFQFFDNITTVEIDYELKGLIVQTSVEKILVASGSSTLEEDYQVISNLVEVNHKNMTTFVEKPKNNNINKKPEDKQKLANVDSRFKTDGYIISNNYIPKGFVFKELVVVASAKNIGLGSLTNPQIGYIKAYEHCLALIKETIDNGRVDAVFNLKYTTQSVQGSYEVVMSGDGVIVDEEKQD